MQVDGVERVFAFNGLGHHHHPGDPEKQDVLSGDQHVTGEVLGEFVGLFRPAERAERPQA